jgi:polysaccharide export outer membrane protein
MREHAAMFGHAVLRSLTLIAVLSATACAPGAGLSALPTSSSAAYRLGPGDRVRIITLADESLTGEFHVGDDGNVALPMLGAVRAAGRTPADFGKAIAATLLRDGLERDPSVSVEVSAYRPIFVLGEVNKPGEFAYQPGMTVVAAVALAGGFTYRAIDDYASVVRTATGRPVEGRAERQTALAPGDVVTIYERRF